MQSEVELSDPIHLAYNEERKYTYVEETLHVPVPGPGYGARFERPGVRR